MKSFNPFPCRTNDAVLMVSSYNDGEITGWLVHSRLESPQRIRSVPQLLFKLDEFLQSDEKPVIYHAFEPTRYENIQRIATLRIQILFQDHYTWQGCVLWEDRHIEMTFHSVLELIQILDEILVE